LGEHTCPLAELVSCNQNNPRTKYGQLINKGVSIKRIQGSPKAKKVGCWGRKEQGYLYYNKKISKCLQTKTKKK